MIGALAKAARRKQLEPREDQVWLDDVLVDTVVYDDPRGRFSVVVYGHDGVATVEYVRTRPD